MSLNKLLILLLISTLILLVQSNKVHAEADTFKGEMIGFVLADDSKKNPITNISSIDPKTGATNTLFHIPSPPGDFVGIGAQKLGNDQHIVAWTPSGYNANIYIVDLKAKKLVTTVKMQGKDLPMNLQWDGDVLLILTTHRICTADVSTGKVTTVKNRMNLGQANLSFNPKTRTAMWFEYLKPGGGNIVHWERPSNTIKTIPFDGDYVTMKYTGTDSSDIFGIVGEKNATTGIVSIWIVKVDVEGNKYEKLLLGDDKIFFTDIWIGEYDSDNYVIFTAMSFNLVAYKIPKANPKNASTMWNIPCLNAGNMALFTYLESSSRVQRLSNIQF